MKMKTNWLCIHIVLMLFASVYAVGFYGLHFKGLEEPAWIGTRILDQKWMQQPIDHFNHRDNRTWLMRYYEEDKYFNGSGPIFIMLGGEWTINPGFLQSGLMHSLAKQHGALMFYTEHRYYGNSKPTQDISSDNMQYLNVDQALADVAYFIDNRKIQMNISNSKVIVFGGSYAGNMAAWIRTKYPHLIQGAVASSAPVYAKADFYAYYEVVTASLKRHDAQCATDVQTAFDQTEKLLASKGGPKKIRELFNLCENPNVKSTNDISYLMNFLSEIFASNVQYNKIVNGKSKISILCDTMTNASIGKPIERLAHLVNKEGDCIDVSYLEFVKKMRNDSWSSNPMKQWYFQTCHEFGYYQTSNSNQSVFGTLFHLDFFVNICTDVYGDYYENHLLENGIRRTNIMYGGIIPDVRNIIFVNGDVDPWHALSILHDINEFSPAILIHGSSHCQDLQSDDNEDVPELRAARERIKNIVSIWLQ
ncbi:PREDICTED: thymus-specific serine protease-like [Ceratosolen solmsi marchali]|uniref:Thymus-specific serine protease-like n=1 Tax=Ceratosolen solmsi marchali TaxID=326594 RepID=A0AAJ6YH65_9HYME|nr:PREDICTED: thymus-specific serine protease-like [Ceratosolen solmsi marchali]